VAVIAVMATRIVDPPRTGRKPNFDFLGAVLVRRRALLRRLGDPAVVHLRLFSSRVRTGRSATPVILSKGRASRRYGSMSPSARSSCCCSSSMSGSRERAGKDALLSPRLFPQPHVEPWAWAPRTVQWLVMQGNVLRRLSFSCNRSEAFSAIQTGSDPAARDRGSLAVVGLGSADGPTPCSGARLIRGGFCDHHCRGLSCCS